jgi:hypothetical protein
MNHDFRLGLVETVKATAMDDLTTALGTNLEANYTAENWKALKTASIDGYIAINAATDPAAVAAAKVAAMEAVPMITEGPAT